MHVSATDRKIKVRVYEQRVLDLIRFQGFDTPAAFSVNQLVL